MENLDHINKRDEEIRRIFQEPLSADDSWAQPDDRVWEGIEAALPPRKRRGAFWWWLGGATFLLMGAMLVLPRNSDSGATSLQITKSSLASTIPADGWDIPNDHDQHIQNLFSKKGAPSAGPTRLLNGSSPESDIDSDAAPSIGSTPVLDVSPVQLPVPFSSDHEAIPIPTDVNIEKRAIEEAPRAEIPVPVNRSPETPAQVLTVPLPDRVIATNSVIGLPDQPDMLIAIAAPLAPNAHSASVHRLMVYGQGFGADREIERKTSNLLFDAERGHQNSQFRIGVGYEWQHKSGFFIGSGIEYQDFQEEVVKEKSWTFTTQNGTEVGSDLYQQNIPLVINSGFGTASTILRVDIHQSNPVTDYQEGDQVSFRMSVDHSLKWMRIPVLAGYHYQWKNWFAEIRGGVGLQIFLTSDATITQVMDDRGKISLQQSQSTKSIKHVRSTIWDTQAAVYAGYQWSDAWSVSCGYERWYSLQSVVDRPNVNTFTNGSGLQVALRRTF